jgi:ABC-type multidrug transport system fused ATPase/permease subunit
VAQPVDIGAAKPAKIRNPVAVAILTFVTVFIYLFFWWYFINREMADYGKQRGTAELGDNPTKSVLAITLGLLVIVPFVWTIVTTFKRVQALQRLTGESQPINGWIGLILAVVIEPALFGYMQSGLNSSWRAVQARGLEERA